MHNNACTCHFLYNGRHTSIWVPDHKMDFFFIAPNKSPPGLCSAWVCLHYVFPGRARNKGRSTDNVRTDCGFERSNFRLAGQIQSYWKWNKFKVPAINCFSCYLSSRCVLRNFDMKFWWHATGAVDYNSRIETSGFAHFRSQNYQIFPTFWVYGPLKR